jgi:hypothetical protein
MAGTRISIKHSSTQGRPGLGAAGAPVKKKGKAAEWKQTAATLDETACATAAECNN